MGRKAKTVLLVRTSASTCALPLEDVVETMRPLRVEPVAGAPSFILGISLVRGAPLPVVDLSAITTGRSSVAVSRFVTVRVGERRVSLAVDAVIGVRELGHTALEQMPPLLSEASPEVIAAIGTLDAMLLLVLRGARLALMEASWTGSAHDEGA